MGVKEELSGLLHSGHDCPPQEEGRSTPPEQQTANYTLELCLQDRSQGGTMPNLTDSAANHLLPAGSLPAWPEHSPPTPINV